jgi:mRNA interferase RelE/StbE
VNPPFAVRISGRAERDLDRLPEKIAAACVEFIFGPLAENPYRLGGRLEGRLAGLLSARRGTYRVVYQVNDDDYAIEITHIDHRQDVYR